MPTYIPKPAVKARTGPAFKRSVNGFIDRAIGRSDFVVRKVALQVLASLIQKSPVDTGRFRGNWFVQEAITPVQRDANDKGGGMTLEAGSAQIASFKIGDRIYILNHLPYSIELEHGSSQQAPSGMVMITVAEFESYFRSIGGGFKS